AASSAPAPGLASSAPAVARAAPRTLAERGTELRRSFGAAFTRARADLRRSVGYGTLAALVGLAPAFVIAHAIARHRERAWARALEFAALLPLALPGCVVGIAAILLWNSDWLSSLYATSVPAVAVLTGRFLPLCVLVLGVAFARQDPALEEAAAMAGASPLHRMVRIVAPMAAGACVLAALAVYACAVRELDIAVLVPALNSTAIVRLYNGVHFARDGYVAALALLLAASIVLPFGVWALARGPRRLEQA
ncbi:MAG: ABC transporter permease subunit, partial [Planctomycetota bacterium]